MVAIEVHEEVFMSTKYAMIVSALAVFSGQALAEGAVAVATPVVDKARIAPLPGGEITRGEAARIRYQIKEHKKLQRMAAADGVITRSEKARLAYDAAKVRRLIHRAKTN
jgi:hypothetical protein